MEIPLPVGSVPAKTSEELQAEWESFTEMIGMVDASSTSNETEKVSKSQEGSVSPKIKETEVTENISVTEPDETNVKGEHVTVTEECPVKAKCISSDNEDSSSDSSSSDRSSGSSSESHSDDDDKKPTKPVKSKSKSPIELSVKLVETESPEKTDQKDIVDKKKERCHHSRSPSHSRDHHRRRNRRERGRRKRSRSGDRRRRSKDRHHRHGSRDRKRHRSRDRDRHRRRLSKSRSRTRRSRSRDRRRRSRTPNSRRKRSLRSPTSRHHRPEKCRSPSPIKKMTFKDQLRANFIKAQKDMEKGISESDKREMIKVNEKPSNLPLYDNPLLAATGGKPLTSETAQATPQLAFLQTMAAMHQKAQELTGVSVPKYYNPAAVNPLKYAEQIQKRKLLWSKARENREENKVQWCGTVFPQDQDGKVASKFRKLMGIKGEAEPDKISDVSKLSEEQKKKRDELFQRLDHDYEFARMTTHTHRGIGLGFTSQCATQMPQAHHTQQQPPPSTSGHK